MNVIFKDTFFESLKDMLWHNSRLGKLVDLFRYDIPNFIKNLWYFKGVLWRFRYWDARHNLDIFKVSLERTIKSLENGSEEDVSRLKKIARMKRVIELLDNFIEDNFSDQAEIELGMKRVYNFSFTPMPDKGYSLDNNVTPEQEESNDKIRARAYIPLDKLWDQYNRLLKPNGIIALTASQPFSSALVMSNPKMFKHEWIWIKNRGSNFANTVREPFKEHEQVLIFSKGGWTYNKQMQERTGAGADRVKYDLNHRSKSENYREFEGREGVKLPEMRVPSSWQKFNTDTSGLHPTIKPTPLFEYLINTYTEEGGLVLDNCAGSGTTGVACKNTKRHYVMIEQEQKYFDGIMERLAKVRDIPQSPTLF